MRYLLKTQKKTIKIVREKKAIIKGSAWRRRLGVIISAVMSGLLATVVTVISTRNEVEVANLEARKARQSAVFIEVWAAAEIYALEVDRMSRMSGIYLLAEKLQSKNPSNPIAKNILLEGNRQYRAMGLALSQAEVVYAKNKLLLTDGQRHVLGAYLTAQTQISDELLSFERRQHFNFEVNQARLEALRLDAARFRSMAEYFIRDSY